MLAQPLLNDAKLRKGTFCNYPAMDLASGRLPSEAARQTFPFCARAKPGIGPICEYNNAFGLEAHVAWRCGGSRYRRWRLLWQLRTDGGDLGRYELQTNFRAAEFH